MDPIAALLAARKAAAFLGRHWALVALAAALLAAGIQSHRLEVATLERDAARDALVNPASGKTWKVEALRDGQALATCLGSLTTQNAAVAAAKATGDRMAARAATAAREARVGRVDADARSRAVMAATIDAATCEAREAQLLDLAAGVVR